MLDGRRMGLADGAVKTLPFPTPSRRISSGPGLSAADCVAPQRSSWSLFRVLDFAIQHANAKRNPRPQLRQRQNATVPNGPATCLASNIRLDLPAGLVIPQLH
jgi:hypothetical protein